VSAANPLVSVIVPAYNAERFLAESIESVFAQTYSPIEIVVINDGSTDGTEAVARRFSPRITFASQPNGGISAARNAAIGMATGLFFAFQDSDDVWMPRKTEIQMAAFQADPSLDMVFGGMQEFSSASNVGPVVAGVVPGTMIVKRESFLRVGLFDPSFKIAEFLHWYLLAREKGLRELLLPDLVLKRRIHGDNIGIRERKEIRSYARILKGALDRRRASGPS